MATSPEAPALQIRILGNPDLRSGETPLAPLESARAVSLLGYLLVHRGAAQPRQRLAFLLWPDSTEAQARTNLRHVLHTLRRALPEADRFLEVTPSTLRWRAGGALPSSTSPSSSRRSPPGGCEDAVELYGGDLLEGSYDDWVLEERERLRSACADALERLAPLRGTSGPGGGDPLRRAPRPPRPAARGRAPRAHAPARRARRPRAGDARLPRVRGHAAAGAGDRAVGSRCARPTRRCSSPTRTLAPAPHASPAGPALVGRARERARLTELWRSARARPRAARARHAASRGSGRAGWSRSCGRGAPTRARRQPRRARTRPRARSPTGRSSPGCAPMPSARGCAGSSARI